MLAVFHNGRFVRLAEDEETAQGAYDDATARLGGKVTVVAVGSLEDLRTAMFVELLPYRNAHDNLPVSGGGTP